MKNKLLSVRLSEIERADLEKAAFSKNISPSTFARSLLVTALKNDLEIMQPLTSLTPELDKLDPRVKFALLRPLEIMLSALRANKVNESEIEKILLFSVASKESEIIEELTAIQ